MIRRIGGLLFLLCTASSGAWASCSGPASITDSASTNRSYDLTTGSAGNCANEQFVVQLPAAAALTDTITNPTTTMTGADALLWDATGSVWLRALTFHSHPGVAEVSDPLSTVAVGGAAAPTNALVAGGVYNSSPITVTNANASALQVDANGVLKIDCFTNCSLAQASATSGQAGSLVMGAATTSAPTDTAGNSYPLSLDTSGNLRVIMPAPATIGCAGATVANTNVTPINLASSSAVQLVPLSSGLNVYVCSINLVSATAQNVALIEGTATACASNTAGMAGGTTAATGWNFAANGGLTLGNGVGLVFKTATVSHEVCLVSSSTGQISGSITWAQF